MKKTVVLGVIGSDSHVIGYWVLRHVLETAGFKVVGLGGMSSQQEFIEAAVETKADAIWITSHYGMAPLDCEGFREKLEEAGLKNIPLSIGGILTTDPNE